MSILKKILHMGKKKIKKQEYFQTVNKENIYLVHPASARRAR